MISEKRAEELLRVLLGDKQIIKIINMNKKNSQHCRNVIKTNASLILEHSNVSDIKNDDIIRLTLDLMLVVNAAEHKHRIVLDKEYLIKNCPDLNTGNAFKFTSNDSIFEPVIRKCILEGK